MTSARIAAPSFTARPVRTTLVSLSLATALLTGLLATLPAPAASVRTSSSEVTSGAPITGAWEVLPEFPHRLTAWLYESQRRLSLSASSPAAVR